VQAIYQNFTENAWNYNAWNVNAFA
jgi:hypothetical protein